MSTAPARSLGRALRLLVAISSTATPAEGLLDADAAVVIALASPPGDAASTQPGPSTPVAAASVPQDDPASHFQRIAERAGKATPRRGPGAQTTARKSAKI